MISSISQKTNFFLITPKRFYNFGKRVKYPSIYSSK